MKKKKKPNEVAWRFVIEDHDYGVLLSGTSNSIRTLFPQIGDYLLGIQHRNNSQKYVIRISPTNGKAQPDKIGKKYIV